MSASSSSPNIVEVGLTFINNQTGLVNIQDHVWTLDEGEEFVGIAVVSTTPKEQENTKLIECKK